VANVTRKRLGELMRGAFAVLSDATEPIPSSQVIRLTAVRVPPTPFELEMLPKHQTIRRYDNLIRFATLPAVKAASTRACANRVRSRPGTDGSASRGPGETRHVLVGRGRLAHQPYPRTVARLPPARRRPPRRQPRDRRGPRASWP
jgi:hypothetical protein